MSKSTGNGDIVCNDSDDTTILPSLEVVKTVPKMSAGVNIDWLLHIYFARRDFARCKQLIERELQRHLNPEYLYFVKGLIEREEGNNIEALRNLQRAIDLNPKNIETYKEIGKTLYFMGRYAQALNVFREAEEELQPRVDHEVFHYIGELLYRSAVTPTTKTAEAVKQQQEAKTYFQKAVQCGKKLESFQRLAEIHRTENEHSKAIDVLEQCLLLSPENTDVLTEIGVLYLKISDTQKAFDRLLDVANKEKHCPRGLLALGAIVQSRNDVDTALGKYKEVAAAEPDWPEVWNNIGLCFFKKQKFIAAISSLRKATWLSPLNYNALYNLSLIYIRAQQYASAFHTLTAAINLRKSDNAECYMLLGICLRKLEDNENAFIAFQRSAEIAAMPQPPPPPETSANNSNNITHTAAIQHKGNNANSTAIINAPRHPLVHLNFALFCYEIGRIALATEQYNRFVHITQDISLPTDYKFHATKLKALLKISTTHILQSSSSALDAMAGGGRSALVSAADTEALLSLAAGANELPLEVNAVVNAVGMTIENNGSNNSHNNNSSDTTNFTHK